MKLTQRDRKVVLGAAKALQREAKSIFSSNSNERGQLEEPEDRELVTSYRRLARELRLLAERTR